ncbi:hypothetical protein QUA20_29245 [Microcoleus sp. Pol7_A1]|nr:hypothetical protein [Microcoleus asticus]
MGDSLLVYREGRLPTDLRSAIARCMTAPTAALEAIANSWE